MVASASPRRGQTQSLLFDSTAEDVMYHQVLWLIGAVVPLVSRYPASHKSLVGSTRMTEHFDRYHATHGPPLMENKLINVREFFGGSYWISSERYSTCETIGHDQ